MSDEDSLNEMSSIPARLMPRAQNLAEHHRVLGTNAIHVGNSLATMKAHKVRQDGLEEKQDDLTERVDTLEQIAREVGGIRVELAGVSAAMSKHGEIIGQLGLKLEVEKSGIDLKKTIVIAVFGLLGTLTTALGGYWIGNAHTNSGPAYVAPTHQQAVEIDQKLKEMDPEGKHGFAPH